MRVGKPFPRAREQTGAWPQPSSRRPCRRVRKGRADRHAKRQPHGDIVHRHARHNAEARSYLYQISRRKTAFFKPYVWWIKEDLDVGAMREAARVFEGMHDFASFAADEPGEKSTRVLVDRLEIHGHGDLILIRIVGSHFLWRMVRRIVGVLAAVGRGEFSSAQAAAFLEQSSELPATLTAPASGLFLERVYYAGDIIDNVVNGPISVPSVTS